MFHMTEIHKTEIHPLVKLFKDPDKELNNERIRKERARKEEQIKDARDAIEKKFRKLAGTKRSDLNAEVFLFPRYDPKCPDNDFREPCWRKEDWPKEDPNDAEVTQQRETAQVRSENQPQFEKFKFFRRLRAIRWVFWTFLLCSLVSVCFFVAAQIFQFGQRESLITVAVIGLTWATAWPWVAYNYAIVRRTFTEDILENAFDEAEKASEGWQMATWLSIMFKIIEYNSGLLWVKKIRPLQRSLGSLTPNDIGWYYEKIRKAGLHVFANFSATGKLSDDDRREMQRLTTSELRYDQAIGLMRQHLPRLIGRFDGIAKLAWGCTRAFGLIGLVVALCALLLV
jgi:hypothetical protein